MILIVSIGKVKKKLRVEKVRHCLLVDVIDDILVGSLTAVHDMRLDG